MFNAIGIIPARMESSRFPGKPLAKICGKPMIKHVYDHSVRCKNLEDVYIATCNEEIFDYMCSVRLEDKTIMTSNLHTGASDRVVEALSIIERIRRKKYDVITMIQGDEPMISTSNINKVTLASASLINQPLNDIQVCNLMTHTTVKEASDPNEIKVIINSENNAIYFSRSVIPSLSRQSKKEHVHLYKQVCAISFTRSGIKLFNSLRPGPLENAELIDMLRFIENGYSVRMVHSFQQTYSVDTPKDLKKVAKIMRAAKNERKRHSAQRKI